LPADGAAAVQFEPVAFDFEAGRLRQVTGEVGDRALVEVLDAAAVGADEVVVVVVAAAGKAVVEAAVLEEDAADDADFGQQADRPEDGGAAGASAAVQQVVDRKAVSLGEYSCDHRPPRRRHAMSMRLQFQSYNF
jgi:hypothetical protein